jgi:hypothetical protein
MLHVTESFDPALDRLLENQPYIECWLSELNEALNLLDILNFHLSDPSPEISGRHLISLLRTATNVMSIALDEYSLILNLADKSHDRQMSKQEKLRRLNEETLQSLNQRLRDSLTVNTNGHDTCDTVGKSSEQRSNKTSNTPTADPNISPNTQHDPGDTLVTSLLTHGHDTCDTLPFTLGSPGANNWFTAIHKLPQVPTSSHKLPQAPTNSHKLPQAPTNSHKLPQAPTNSHKLPQFPQLH